MDISELADTQSPDISSRSGADLITGQEFQLANCQIADEIPRQCIRLSAA